MAEQVTLEIHDDEMTAYDAEGRRVGMVFFREADGVWDFLYSEVPREYRQHGYGEAITRAAFALAKEEGVLVEATCGFMRRVALRDPELAGQLVPHR
jgi:predicted GNAT family acetyltransferase